MRRVIITSLTQNQKTFKWSTNALSRSFSLNRQCRQQKDGGDGDGLYFDDSVMQFLKKAKSQVQEDAPGEFERRLKRKLGLPDDYEKPMGEENPFFLQREQAVLNLIDNLFETTPLPDLTNIDTTIKSEDDELAVSKKLKDRFGFKEEELQEKERLAATLSFDQGSNRIFQEDHLQKFYKSMSIHPHTQVTPGGESGFVVRIGAEQLLRSASGKVVIFPNRHLAAAVIGEWELQRGYIRPTTLPLTELVCQWQDLKSDAIEGYSDFGRLVKRTVTGFFDSELITHRQDLTSKSTQALIKKLWDPITTWFEKEYNVKLNIAGPKDDFSGDWSQSEAREIFIERYTSAEPLKQFREFFMNWTSAIDMAYMLLDKLKPHELVILYAGTQITKSILIPLAIMHGQIDCKTACEASQLPLRQQTKGFGLVEGEHDVIFAEEAARLSALQLFKTLVEYENK